MNEIGHGEPRWIAGIEPSAEMLRCNGTQVLEIECREQPARLRELIEHYSTDPGIRFQLHNLRSLSQGEGPLFFIGMGASLCASIGASTFLQSHGRVSFSMDAGEWLHYSQPIWNQAALSILLTTSGESAELVELFKSAGTERPLGLICNNPASACWGIAQHRLPVMAGPEYGNATKTYTNSSAAAIILACEMLSQPWEREAHEALETLDRCLDPIFAMRGELEQFSRGAANIEIIGRGAAYGAAVMSALCIREMSGHRAAAHTGAGFKHGPNLDVDASHVAIIFAVGRAADLGLRMAKECNQRGGKVILLSNDDHPATDALFPVRIDKVTEPWEGITSLLVPQALTLAMIEKTGCRLPPRFQYGVMQQ